MRKITVLYLVLMMIANFIFVNTINSKNTDYSKVEANRIYNQIMTHGFVSVNRKDFNSVSNIYYLDVNPTKEELEEFYQISNSKYVIYPIFKETGESYVRIDFKDTERKNVASVIIILNGIFLVIYIFIYLIVYYIKKNILKPFKEIVDLPYELSSGNLTTSLKESKNKYFGKFLWGLDILRNNLEQAKIRELELEKEKKAIILSLSHDIKTPLSSIKLYAKALEEELYSTKEKQNEVAHSIGEKTIEIENYVKKIMDSATNDLVHIEVHPTKLYVKEIIEKLQGYYKEKLMLLHTEFVIEPYDNCIVWGDLDRILEALENIMENAIKYGDGKKINIRFSEEEDCQLITVENTGCELSSTEVIHIFESFWRGSNALDKRGSGLGLYISRELIHAMEGEIYANVVENIMKVTVVLKR